MSTRSGLKNKSFTFSNLIRKISPAIAILSHPECKLQIWEVSELKSHQGGSPEYQPVNERPQYGLKSESDWVREMRCPTLYIVPLLECSPYHTYFQIVRKHVYLRI